MTNAARIRILSVDDHPLFQEGIGALLNCQPDMSLLGVASKGTEAIEAFRALQPDVTLMDLRLPDLSGLAVLITIRSEFPEARIIVLTTFERDAEILRGGEPESGHREEVVHRRRDREGPPQAHHDEVRCR